MSDPTMAALVYREARHERQLLAHKVADLVRAGQLSQAYALARSEYAQACQMAEAAMDKWQAELEQATS